MRGIRLSFLFNTCVCSLYEASIPANRREIHRSCHHPGDLRRDDRGVLSLLIGHFATLPFQETAK